MKAFSPVDAVVEKARRIPPEVVEIFNNLIAKHLVVTRNVNFGGDHRVRSRVPQGELVSAISSKTGYTREAVFTSGYLDIEVIFEEAGWTVEYVSQSFSESEPAHFVFSSFVDKDMKIKHHASQARPPSVLIEKRPDQL